MSGRFAARRSPAASSIRRRLVDQAGIADRRFVPKALAPAFALRREKIGGQRERDRSRPRSAEEMKGALDGGGNLLRVVDGLRPAADGREAIDLVGHLVERAQTLADQRRRNVGHDHQHGLRAGEGLDEGRQRIGRAGAGRDNDHTWLSGRSRVAVGHEGRALLVAGEDVGDVPLADQGIVDGEVVDAGEPEDVADALTAQGLDDPLAAGAQLRPASCSGAPRRGSRPSSTRRTRRPSRRRARVPSAARRRWPAPIARRRCSRR